LWLSETIIIPKHEIEKTNVDIFMSNFKLNTMKIIAKNAIFQIAENRRFCLINSIKDIPVFVKNKFISELKPNSHTNS